MKRWTINLSGVYASVLALMKPFYIFIATFLVALAGCGESKVQVSGKVTFEDGTPITSGQVLFSTGEYAVTGDIKSDSTYKLGERKDGDGIRPGKYTVSVVNVTKPDPTSPDPQRPNMISLTDESFSKQVDVVKSMTVDLQVPPKK